MGEVYEAVRDDGKFQRRVAVKFVRSTLSRGEMIRRFEAERSVLASLQHPNIAQLIDAGTDEEAMPYLIMEFVDGKRIDEYCDEHQLSTATSSPGISSSPPTERRNSLTSESRSSSARREHPTNARAQGSDS
jgi:serine/threonine protein kinase